MESPASFAQSLLSQQVRWQHPTIVNSGIDQTRLAIADAPIEVSDGEGSSFSFLVIGDTDAGNSAGNEDVFSQAFAEQVVAHSGDCRFLLHTGDVAYPTGSYKNYFNRFLVPYQALLKQLPSSPFYNSREIIFDKALLSVPGNHDYSDCPTTLRYWKRLLRMVCDRLRSTTGVDLGCYGGEGGEAYSQTFLDDLKCLAPEQLKTHLSQHYAAKVDDIKVDDIKVDDANDSSNYCLSYQPGRFTRLPNRYYTFRYGDVDFFALDSNTWNTSPDKKGFDQAQLDWLEASLIHSWQTPSIIGRIVYLHHSPYTTEALHWQQPETMWVRKHLRKVFDSVAQSVKAAKGNSPVVDLVLSGHAHCLEHLKTSPSLLGDSEIDWVVCGGSGASVRGQRGGNAEILEKVSIKGRHQTKIVARSQQFIGRQKHRRKEQALHSFVRIDINPQQTQKIVVSPLVVTQINGEWRTKALAPLATGTPGSAYQPEAASDRASEMAKV